MHQRKTAKASPFEGLSTLHQASPLRNSFAVTAHGPVVARLLSQAKWCSQENVQAVLWYKIDSLN